MDFQEEVICGTCKTKYKRELEIIETFGKCSDINQSLKFIIVKKFVCKKCQESNNYSVDIKKKKDKVKKDKINKDNQLIANI